MDDDSGSFGTVLRQLRTSASLSQEALAALAGLSTRGISDLERGARRVPHLTTVRLLVDALDLSPVDRSALLAAARPAIFTGSTDAASLGHTPLPVPLSPLIGRERELADLAFLVERADGRLVTLTGPGGTGKTRLALAVGIQLAAGFSDGVVFVDLAPLDDAGLVLPEVATALRLRETGGRPLIATVQRYLAAREMLLILDNFEHVLDAAPIVVELLSAAQRTKVLATSRAPLRLYGEQEYLVPSLGLPAASEKHDLASLAASEAVTFFVDRALAVRPTFALTADNAPAVAETCRRLDGLPLALELAAARVRIIPPGALLKRLEQRLPLLTGGARTLPARQQTMRNTIAWSHDLLSSDEQTIFHRLAVFPGGCTIDAAETAAGPDGTLDVFGGIASLVEGSLLRQEEGVGGESRFRMLETVREFGLEHLEASGDSDATRGRLAAWCLALAEQTEPDVFGGNMSPAWVARLDEELPNLRAAVTLLLERGEATRALRLLTATEDFWTQRLTSHMELFRWLETALAEAPDAPARDRVLAHWLLSTGNGALGQDEAALLHAERLLAAAEESGEPAGLGFAHVAFAQVWEDRGDIKRSAAAYAAAIPVWWVQDGPEGGLYPQAELADKLVIQGDLGVGVPMLEDALTRLRQTGPPWWIVLVINLRGHAARRQGDLPLAARLFAEANASARDLHDMRTILGTMAGLAGVALAYGQAARAAGLLGAIESERESSGIKRITGWLHGERITADARAALEVAAFERAWLAGRALPLEEAITEALSIADEIDAGTTH